MDSRPSRQEQLARVVHELTTSLRTQARAQWKGVKTAQRRQGSREVWRFRVNGGTTERFLHVPHKAITLRRDAADVLLEQLGSEKWLDRLQAGPETAFVLSPTGRLQPVRKA
jgi:hypothetical protein